ncbi:hypothetical protein DACRYDRAFT_98605 [Dacryopinax primogenitus]|uniref:Uncharacterized protein n=1 Tax=Dacryopinax primogenitus (strain DJM 731) TaxID=1858805 RepID=M5G7V0_DACPD|nr:uncharacterized protein DACRYDRAFT_98605 [Dacryopinax primogenitus]EJU04829.1 hypothetical protein DACRYDRAFT_98605 [Dacryopinax primogenitus]
MMKELECERCEMPSLSLSVLEEKEERFGDTTSKDYPKCDEAEAEKRWSPRPSPCDGAQSLRHLITNPLVLLDQTSVHKARQHSYYDTSFYSTTTYLLGLFAMPLPDERPRGSVANLIGKFEQQSKRASDAAGQAVERALPGSLRNSLAGRVSLGGNGIGVRDAKQGDGDKGKEDGTKSGLLGLLEKKEEVKEEKKEEETKPVEEVSTVEPEPAPEPAKPVESSPVEPLAPPAPTHIPPEPAVPSPIASSHKTDVHKVSKIPPVPHLPKSTSRSAVGSTRTPASTRAKTPTFTRAKTPTSKHPPSSAASASAIRVKASTLTSSTSGSASKQSPAARPASRARTAATPSPVAAHSRTHSTTIPVTSPRSLALSAPTASSLAKARSPPTRSPTVNTAASPPRATTTTTRRMSMSDKDTPSKPAGSGTTAPKRGTPTAVRGTTATRGTKPGTRGAAASAAGAKRALAASTSALPDSGASPLCQVPGVHPPQDHPGGDEPTSEAVAQRELELINAHVPPLRLGTNGSGEQEDVHDKGATDLAEVTSANESSADHEETKEEIERSEDRNHPEFRIEEEVDKEEVIGEPEEAPPKEVLDFVQLEGITSVDAEGIAVPDVDAQARAHALHDGEEGVGAIPDEDDD